MSKVRDQPKKESSELLVIKFLGWGFFGCLFLAGVAMIFNHADQLQIWTHLATFLAGCLAGALGTRVHPISKSES